MTLDDLLGFHNGGWSSVTIHCTYDKGYVNHELYFATKDFLQQNKLLKGFNPVKNLDYNSTIKNSVRS